MPPAQYGDIYASIVGPANFGPGGIAVPNSGSGDLVGPASNVSTLQVPNGYVSGAPLLSSSTWDNTTLQGLGVTPGTYVWTWGSGDHADSFTLKAGWTAVPEPGTWTLLATALAGLGLLLGAGRARGRG